MIVSILYVTSFSIRVGVFLLFIHLVMKAENNNRMLSRYLLVPFLLVMAGSIQGQPDTDNKIYTFALGRDSKPYHFLDEDGEQMGFALDVTRKVCEIANKTCSFISYNNDSLCWNSDRKSGEGLDREYWDVCSSFYDTKDRSLVYSFFGEYGRETPSFLYVKEFSSIGRFFPERHVTGFVQDSWLSVDCLMETNQWTVRNQRVYDDPMALAQALRHTEVHVALIDQNTANKVGGFRKINKQITCARKGMSMMVRKDRLPDFRWYNPALKELLKSPHYKWLCSIIKLAYGGDPLCLENEND